MSSIMLTQKAVMMPARSSMARATTARRARTVLVRAEEPGKPINTPSEVPAAPEATPMPTPAAPAPPAAPKAVTLSDAMAFNGAPELINGRLAMLGTLLAHTALRLLLPTYTQLADTHLSSPQTHRLCGGAVR